MEIRCSVKALAVLVGLVCCCTLKGEARSDDVSVEKLTRSFEKINAHLEKTVPNSDDPNRWLEEVESLLVKKQPHCLSIGGKSLVRTIQMLLSMPSLPENGNYCSLFFALSNFRKLDAALTDESRCRNHNYPLTKVDLLIQHYAFEAARQCTRTSGKPWPLLTYGLKQAAYDEINRELVKAVPSTSEVEPNMEVAENLLENLRQGPANGAYADALRQFISLKWTESGESCNEEGYKILLKNDLATRGGSHLYQGDFTNKMRDMRRIERVVFRYIKKHANLCGPILRNNVRSALKKLDENSYRRVLGLTSTYYLSTGYFDEIVETVSLKSVSEPFTSLPMIVYARELISCYNSGGLIKLNDIESFNEFKLRHYVKTLLAKDPTAANKGKPENFSPKQVKEMLDKYLFVPCNNYMSMLSKYIELDEYNVYADNEYLKSPKSLFIANLDYHMARAANQACRYVSTKRQSIIDNFLSYNTKALANGVFFWKQN